MTRPQGNRLPLVPRSRAVTTTLAGLVVGVIGILVQFAVEPQKFPVVPPGAFIVAGCAGAVWFMQRLTWGTLPGVLIAVQIVVIGGFIGGEMTANFQSPIVATVIANIVILVGLATAAIAGTVAMVAGLRARRSERAHRH